MGCLCSNNNNNKINKKNYNGPSKILSNNSLNINQKGDINRYNDIKDIEA